MLKTMLWTPQRDPQAYLRKIDIFPDITLLQHPPIPPSLWGVNPRNLYGVDWWKDIRYRTYRRFNWCCWACGVPAKEAIYRPGRLDAHETYEYQGILRQASFAGTVALCSACHEFIHRGHMKTLMLKGKIGATKVDTIIQRGMQLLNDAGLRPTSSFNIDGFQKDGWKLLLDDRQFSVDDLMRLRGNGPSASKARRIVKSYRRKRSKKPRWR